jgi:hypothetical protein
MSSIENRPDMNLIIIDPIYIPKYAYKAYVCGLKRDHIPKYTGLLLI